MRAAFLGTPHAALPALETLAEVAEIEAVFTRPDRARGRSKELVASPIKRLAAAKGWSVFQPATSADLTEAIVGLPPIDVGVVVAFGMILEAGALSAPNRGMINLHFSLLPRWRGAAPVERAILAGDTETGVTLMVMDEGLDTGPILSTVKTTIEPDESAGMVTDRLADIGASLLAETLPGYVTGQIEAVPQPRHGATYAHKLSTAEAKLLSAETAESLLAKVRAFNPRPGAFALWRGVRIKIWEARPAVSGGGALPPGTLTFNEGSLLLHTATYPVELVSVQPAGKPVMAGAAWARGRIGDLGSFE